MLTYYQNSLQGGMSPQPNEFYRELQQAAIDDQWDNTSAKYTVKEQEELGSKRYRDIEVWMNYVVGEGSTGYKNGEDFVQLGFQSIDHICTRGRYYKFQDNVWLTYFTDDHNGLSRTLAVRRCNNALRWVNPDNGAIEAVPCVVDYDMSSPAIQINQSILTPNNHATIMIQGNDLTINQLKTNMRFILGNRPFKLYGYQNTLLDDLTTPTATLLYLDLYLDEIQANDDMLRKIAFNGHYNYTIVPNQLSIEVMPNTIGKLSTNVLLNGADVIRPVTWISSNLDVIQIDSNGEYTITGSDGDTASVFVWIKGNPANQVEIPIAVADVVDDTLDIHITPLIDRIREHETIEFEVRVSKHGAPYDDFVSQVSLDETQAVHSNKFLSIVDKGNNTYELSCTAFNSTLKTLYITATDTANNNTFQESFDIRTVNMFG